MSLSREQFKKVAILAARQADQKSAENILLLDLGRHFSGLADFVLILSGNSEPHLRAIRDEIETLFDGLHLVPLHQDGKRGTSWVVLDYGGLLVHIFHEEKRAFYGLERQLEEAKVLQWQENPVAVKPSPRRKKTLVAASKKRKK